MDKIKPENKFLGTSLLLVCLVTSLPSWQGSNPISDKIKNSEKAKLTEA